KVKETHTTIQLPDDLPEGTTLAVKTTDTSTEGFDLAGEMYDFDFTFPEEYEDDTGEFVLTMGVDKDAENASIYHYNGQSKEWEPIDGDKDNGQITATVEGFSTYGVLQPEE